MNHTKLPAICVAALLLILQPVLAPLAGAQARPYDRLVVFGDSLTDPGNAFVLLGTVETPPFDPLPSAPYARGGLHFSNGPTWVEQLAVPLRLTHTAGPALRAPGTFSNYAVATARARLPLPFHLSDQVLRFLADFGGEAPAGALYVVHIGVNDVRDAITALAADPTGTTSAVILADTLAAIHGSITTLIQAGARTFLVPNVPDPAILPAVSGQPLPVRLAATALATSFNAQLQALLTALDATPGVTIVPLDLFAIFAGIIQDPAAAGLTDVVTPCLNFGSRQQPFCTQPDRFLFWDVLHPTRAGHRLVAEAAYSALTAP